ncbi:UNVERIFIED_CONTAM: DNA topoisomerase 1 [Sesamum radiatum]|uniref:DNA topoisomerase 1 n=1 Tax=Sesamum radiatum TaxID=300843 RepID=A0AAW2JX79_SESRA
MKVAQKLYEGVQLSDGKATGLITYMRTDGLHYQMKQQRISNPSLWKIHYVPLDVLQGGISRLSGCLSDAETFRIRNNEDDEHQRSEVFEILSNLKGGEPLCLTKVEPGQHHTQPPPRYSEGSLVKNLEELGIGRPSTYATTIKVLKDRNYITTQNRTLYPEFRRMVSAFLSNYFNEVTDYSFTADMETELDNVSAGITEWKGLLKDYWTRFSKYCESASKLHIHQVEKMLEKTFGGFIFSSLPDGNRSCPSCLAGNLVFKVSRFGAGYFIGCDQHPKCK